MAIEKKSRKLKESADRKTGIINEFFGLFPESGKYC